MIASARAVFVGPPLLALAAWGAAPAVIHRSSSVLSLISGHTKQ
jgi:hypothetical protein